MCFAETDTQFQHKINPNAELPITRQCELLGISRSTYYYKPVEPDPEAVELKEIIMAEIDRIHTKYPYMGQRKIAKKLRDKGYGAGRKLVRSYMQEMGIYPIYPKPNLSKRNFKEGVLPNVIKLRRIQLRNKALYECSLQL